MTFCREKSWMWVLACSMGILTLFVLGCGPGHYRESADKEVYSIISEKGEMTEGMPSEFTIERPVDETPTPNGEVSDATVVLSLVDAIETAVKNSRDYQAQKESLYLQALSLTDSRHAFDTIFSRGASGDLEKSGGETSVSGFLSTGISKMIETGADLSVSIATNLFRYISGGNPAEAASSAITASLVQPLLRGAGKKVALENLTQSERDMTYAIRDFVRYRRTFSVQIAKSYYALLQRSDRVSNAYNNYQSLSFVRERSESMSKAGRLPEFQVDQARQNELSARDSWVLSIEAYENALDQFKLTLGVPIESTIEVDPNDLARLRRQGIPSLTLSINEAMDAAITNRLDLSTAEDQLEDRGRKVKVAENNLKADLDLSLEYQRDTEATNSPLNFKDGSDRYNVGLDLGLPLDRKSERNSYRRALISYEAANRTLEETRDRVKLDVRDAFRQLKQVETSYEIQLSSLELAQKRAESTKLLQKAGRAITRDVLEAEEALLEAQNAVTSALVDNFGARLDLYLAMETLKIDDQGLWTDEGENNEAK